MKARVNSADSEEAVTKERTATIALIDSAKNERVIYTGPATDTLTIAAFDESARRRILEKTGCTLILSGTDQDKWWRGLFDTCKNFGMVATKPRKRSTNEQWKIAIAAGKRLKTSLRDLLDTNGIGFGNVDQNTFEQVCVFLDWAEAHLKHSTNPRNRQPNLDADFFLTEMQQRFATGFGKLTAPGVGTNLSKFIIACMAECGRTVEGGWIQSIWAQVKQRRARSILALKALSKG